MDYRNIILTISRAVCTPQILRAGIYALDGIRAVPMVSGSSEYASGAIPRLESLLLGVIGKYRNHLLSFAKVHKEGLMDTTIAVITVTVSLLAIIGTLVTAMSTVRKDAFFSLQLLYDKLRKDLDDAQKELKETRAALEAEQKRNDDLEDRLKAAEGRATELENAKKELTIRNVELTAEVEELRKRIDAMKSKK
jgi:hypothetical protein